MWLTERYEATKFTFDEAQIPLTYAKMEMKERNMTPILKYIKSEYVSKKLGLFDKSKKHGMIKLNDMKDNVNGDFSQNQSTQAFHNILKSDIPIVKIMKYGKNKDLFIEPVDYDTLKKWYVNKGFWCEDFDQYTKDDSELEVNNFKAEIYFEKDTKIKEQSEKIKELEQYIIMMENKYKIQQEPIIIEEKQEPIIIEEKQEPIILEEIKEEVIIPVPKKQSSKKVIVKTKITKAVTEVPKPKKETPKKKIVHMHMIDETDDEHYSDADNINDLF
jgi:phage anti-repressor protein